MDNEILHAIWFDCPELSDTAQKLLLALHYHCHHSLTCWPSVGRLSVMIRRTERHTRRLLRSLEARGYIRTKVRRGRTHTSRYTLNRTRICQVLQERGHVGVPSKPDMEMSPEFLEEEEKKKDCFAIWEYRKARKSG